MIGGNERGFSIMEVLLAVVITTIVGGVASAAMIVGLRNLDDQNNRLAGSNDTQLIAGYFTSDVASAETVSTTGTKSHAAPSVTPTVTNTRLVSFWALKRQTGLALPDGMSVGWNDVASPKLQIGLADESTPGAGATGNRVAATTLGTSSITHSVSLARATSTPIARRANVVTRTTPGATSLGLTKPDGWAQNDRLFAHVAVAGGSSTTVVAPDGWTEVDTRSSGTVLKSVVFQKVATSSEPGSYVFSFTDPSGPASREAAIGIAAYSGVLTAVEGLNTKAADVNPCGGETPVLLLAWLDRHADSSEDVSIQVAYNAVAVGAETRLMRLRCHAPTGFDLTGTPTSEQTLATNLAPSAAFATCVTRSPALAATSTTAASAIDSCSYLPVTVTLSVTEPPPRHEPSGRTYLVRATTRTDREAEL